MRKTSLTSLVLLAVAASFAVSGAALSEDAPAAKPAADAKAAPDGKAIFLQYKCNGCHALSAAGIEVKKVEGEETTKKKAPDLSNVGAKKDAAWMKKYLLKQEKLDGEMHSKKFRGTPEELTTLTAWLGTQKSAKGGGAK